MPDKTEKILNKKKVLLIHCEYLQKGGEDKVVAEESKLLEQHYQLKRFIRSNEELLHLNRFSQLSKTIWNFAACRELWACLQSFQPDIVHVHNTFPLLSPAIFRVLRRWKRKRHIHIVYTLHNFRLHCPQATLMRPQHALRPFLGKSAKLCQDCIEQNSFVPAIRAKCYRNNRLMSLVVSVMLALHKSLHTWQNSVDRYIYLNTCQKTLLTRVGFPAEKFVYKPNFLSTGPEFPILTLGNELRLLYFGRLSEEKGLKILLSCLEKLKAELQAEHQAELKDFKVQLRIAGSGPLTNLLQDKILYEKLWRNQITYLGELQDLRGELQNCHFTILPSVWYEGMPMTLLESLSASRPVISFCLGASAEILQHGENALLAPFFQNEAARQQLDLKRIHSDTELAENLATAIKEACRLKQENYQAMCRAARGSYMQCYTPEKNLHSLRVIYEDSL